MIRRKVIRREKGNLTSFHPLFFIFISSLFSVSIHPVSRLSKELMEGWRCPPRWGSKINALPSKFYEVEKRDAASFVTRVPPPFLSFFFFRKKSTTKKILFDAVFPFFFFSLIQISHIAFDLQSNDDFSRCGVSLITEQMKSGLICTGILSSKSNGSHFFFFGEGMINGPIWDIWSILFSFNRYFYYIYSSFSLFL